MTLNSIRASSVFWISRRQCLAIVKNHYRMTANDVNESKQNEIEIRRNRIKYIDRWITNTWNENKQTRKNYSSEAIAWCLMTMCNDNTRTNGHNSCSFVKFIMIRMISIASRLWRTKTMNERDTAKQIAIKINKLSADWWSWWWWKLWNERKKKSQ